MTKREEQLREKLNEKLAYERAWLARGATYIAGTDEVGRGPLAGPVVCAAVIMPLNEEALLLGVDDSKKVSEKNREILAEEIKKRAVAYTICEVSPEEIDRINILNAVKQCMKNCVETLAVTPNVVLADAMDMDFGVESEAIIKGDAKSYTIGAASIIAKVYRDNLMKEYAKTYPEYGFAENKGYGTAAHISAIREKGLCPIHRRTFTKNFWAEGEREPH